ncbi:TPA: hypothetical protein ACGZ9C_003154 [Elizabethkingia anophelis]
MNPAELRVGNYVYYADVLCKVEGYTSDGYLYTNGATAPVSSFQPAELTEEWLLNLGFKKEREHVFWHVNEKIIFTVINYSTPDEVIFRIIVDERLISTKIKYVHHFQNIFFDLISEELML